MTATSDRIGPAQQATLKAIYDLGPEGDPPTAGELAERIARCYGTSGDVSATLARLAHKGLVERAGWSQSGSRCWQITPEGRQVIEGADR